MNTLKPPFLQPSTDALDILRTLVGFDTTSRESNLGLIEWVRDRLRAAGAEIRFTYDGTGRKANLFATLGDGMVDGLVLSGHTDVVPVDGQPWSSDPFRAEIRNGRMYGRGTCDMKGFLACALSAVPHIQSQRMLRPLHLSLSYDEEVGCRGVRGLLDDLRAHGIRPAGCVVGEPTGMGLIVAHKGRREMRCVVRGREAHSSMPHLGANAIEFAAQVIAEVRRLAQREARAGEQDGRFDPPHSTMACTLTHGGIAPNVVPRECQITIDMRCLPRGEAKMLFDELQRFCRDVIVPQMRAEAEDAAIDWHLVVDNPGVDIAEDHPFVGWVRSLVKSNSVGRVAFGTEAGLFQLAGIPTVVCGPGHIAQAHKPDEFVELEQLAQCEELLRKIGAEPHWPPRQGDRGHDQ